MTQKERGSIKTRYNSGESESQKSTINAPTKPRASKKIPRNSRVKSAIHPNKAGSTLIVNRTVNVRVSLIPIDRPQLIPPKNKSITDPITKTAFDQKFKFAFQKK